MEIDLPFKSLPGLSSIDETRVGMPSTRLLKQSVQRVVDDSGDTPSFTALSVARLVKDSLREYGTISTTAVHVQLYLLVGEVFF